jgi:hypothetical protein
MVVHDLAAAAEMKMVEGGGKVIKLNGMAEFLFSPLEKGRSTQSQWWRHSLAAR